MSDDELLRASEEPDDASQTSRYLEDRQEMRQVLLQRGVSKDTIDRASVGDFGTEPDHFNQMVTIKLGGNPIEVPFYLAQYMQQGGKQ